MRLFKTIIVLLTICLVTVFLFSCANPEVTEPPEETALPPVNTKQPEQSNDVQQNEPEPIDQTNIVEVVYFHTAQRCVTCLCFEERITYVIDTYFNDEIENGKLKYIVADISDKNNASIVDKYQAYASQLFINTIIDNEDHIYYISEIWNWKCTKDKPGFDDKIKSLIEQALIEIDY